jgi:hypothetical protein
LRRAVGSADYEEQISGGGWRARFGGSGGRVRGTGVRAEPEPHLPRRSQLQHDHGRLGRRYGHEFVWVDQYVWVDVEFVIDVERDGDGDGRRERNRGGERAGAGERDRWFVDPEPDSDPDGDCQGQARLRGEGEKGAQAAPPGAPPPAAASALRRVSATDVYDRDGERIGFRRWHELMADLDYRRVAETTIAPGHERIWVSTVWLGIDHNFGGDGPPLIFETMVFRGLLDGRMERYPNELAARAGHERWVTAARAAAAAGESGDPERLAATVEPDFEWPLT